MIIAQYTTCVLTFTPLKVPSHSSPRENLMKKFMTSWYSNYLILHRINYWITNALNTFTQNFSMLLFNFYKFPNRKISKKKTSQSLCCIYTRNGFGLSLVLSFISCENSKWKKIQFLDYEKKTNFLNEVKLFNVC